MAMIEIETKLFRSDYTAKRLEDVSDGLLSAGVSQDAVGREDATWAMDARITHDLWRELTPYRDWLIPWQRVVYGNGQTREGPLGHYLVLDSRESHTELRGEVDLNCRDALYLLSRQGFNEKVVIRGGRQLRPPLVQALDGAVLMKGQQGEPLYHVPDEIDATFNHDKEWTRETTRLAFCNDVARRLGCYPLWTSAGGVVITKRRGVERLRNRWPIRSFLANVPPNVRLMDRYARPLGGMASDISGAVKTIPRSEDMDNEIVIVGHVPDASNPRRGNQPRDHRKKIQNDRNKRSQRQERRDDRDERQDDRQDDRERDRRRKQRHDYKHFVDDAASANRVARALLDELSTMNNVVEFQAWPDPQLDFCHETIALEIWNAHGLEVARGHYRVLRVEYGLNTASPLMTVTAGRIEDASDWEEIVGGQA